MFLLQSCVTLNLGKCVVCCWCVKKNTSFQTIKRRRKNKLTEENSPGSRFLIKFFPGQQVSKVDFRGVANLKKHFETLVAKLQVNNYEIVVKVFHISHNLTQYSAIVHKFTRICPVCLSYELTKHFM